MTEHRHVTVWIVAGELWYPHVQPGGMVDDRKVGEGAGDVVAESTRAVAGRAGRVVFDGSALDVGEMFGDGGATEFDGSADRVGIKVCIHASWVLWCVRM